MACEGGAPRRGMAGMALNRAPRSSMLAPFAIRSYRFQWPSDLAMSWAAEMETVILGWFILVQTESVFLLTVFGSLQFAGTLIAPAFGLAGDRIGHRNVLVLMRLTYALLALVLALVILAGQLTPLIALVVAGIAGMVRPSEFGVRNVIVSETVPADRLMSAIGLARITTDSARMAGALAGAGVVAVLGMPAAYGLVVCLYLVSAALTLGIAGRGAEAAGAARAQPIAPLRDLRDAARAVWESPPQLAAMLLALLVNLVLFPFTLGLLPYVAREIYGAGQGGLGTMLASVAFGAIIASLIVSGMGSAVRAARMMMTFGLAWAVLIVVFGQVTEFGHGLVILTLIGVAHGLCTLPMSVLLLRGAPPALRGRIMGMRTLAVYGLPIGLLIAGPLIGRIGFAGTATLYGCLGAVATLTILLRWRRDLWPVHASGNAR